MAGAITGADLSKRYLLLSCNLVKHTKLDIAPKKRHDLNALFARFHDQDMWEKFDKLTSSVTVHFKRVQKAVSRADFPLTAYVLLVQALKNDLCRGLDDDFEEVGKFRIGTSTSQGAGGPKKIVSVVGI